MDHAFASMKSEMQLYDDRKTTEQRKKLSPPISATAYDAHLCWKIRTRVKSRTEASRLKTTRDARKQHCNKLCKLELIDGGTA
jgi:hypothetical protein